jgi:acyl-coenzyme A synthetase/AMP-(fatty) acid ligase
LALIELDGLARRLILCPPGLSADHLDHVMVRTGVDAIVFDSDMPAATLSLPRVTVRTALRVTCRPTISRTRELIPRERQTEWIMLTSGTTGVPKLVAHSLLSLTGAIGADARKSPIVWGTFYDVRRFGGLQILLRTVLCGGSLVLSDAGESIGRYLDRAGSRGLTHVSGTPSQWRAALAYSSAGAISPRYIRLSGEIADQAILDHLRARYPRARVAHAYASTEAGVAFDVDDAIEGFPAGLIGQGGDVDMQVREGSLRIRSPRTASCYIGDDTASLKDADGFIDTGDLLELRGDRYYFVGRRGGIINVGGLKVHPEEVETVINRHPEVRASLVRGRKNLITGAIVVADVVLRAQPRGDAAAEQASKVRREILEACRRALAPYKVPAALSFVADLDLTATGKAARYSAQTSP